MKAWLRKHRTILFFLGIHALVLLVYRDSFNAPFFQDDKLFLNLNLPGDFLRAIPPFHFHPISNQLFYGFAKATFGFNYVWYHVILYLFFFITTIFIYQIAKKILLDTEKAILAVVFWSLNISIFPNFYWIAISYFVIGACFFFGSLSFFLNSRKSSLPLSLIFFLLAVGSNETAFVLPLVLALVTWYQGFSWRRLVSFAILTPILITARLVLVGFSKSSDYSIKINFQFFSTLRWYFFRALNLPEGVQRSSTLIYLLFGVFVLILLVSGIAYFRSPRRNLRFVMFSIGYFFVSALPFFFLPNHMSSYYLTFAIFGPALIVSQILPKRLFLMTILIYVALTFFGLAFVSQTHWIILKNTGPIGQFQSL